MGADGGHVGGAHIDRWPRAEWVVGGRRPGFVGHAGESSAQTCCCRISRWRGQQIRVGLYKVSTQIDQADGSGHFLCGASRLSKRSIVATLTFFPIAIVTATLAPLRLAPQSSYPAYQPSWPVDGFILAIPTVIASLLHRFSLPVAQKARPGSILRLIPYAWAGATFSTGLLLSGMADPAKVLGFLQVFVYQWDPSLLMVLLFAVIPNALFYRRMINKAQIKGKERAGVLVTPKPRLTWATWTVSGRTDIDARLVAGAGLFGIGWGLVGVCPGPAVVGLASAVWHFILTGSPDAFKASTTFVGAMLLGMVSSHIM